MDKAYFHKFSNRVLCSRRSLRSSAGRCGSCRRGPTKAQKAPVKVYTNGTWEKGGKWSFRRPPQRDVDGEGRAATSVRRNRREQPTGRLTDGERREILGARITDARTAVQRSRLSRRASESINGLYAQFVATDDPAQRAVIEQKRLERWPNSSASKLKSPEHEAVADTRTSAARQRPAGWLR